MSQTVGRISQTLVASSLTLVLGTSAHAAFYSGVFDPSSNGDTPAFNGTALFNVAPSCLTPGFHYTSYAVSVGGCGSATVDSATVYLYGNNPGDPSGDPASAIDTLGLANPPEPVLAVLIDGAGNLAGVDTDPMLLTAPTSPQYAGSTFHLQFYTGMCDPYICTPPGSFSTSLSSDPAVIYQNGLISNPARVIFCPGTNPCATLPFPAPEPGSLSLALAALATGVWLSRRRDRPNA